jgi:hypothetical protein
MLQPDISGISRTAEDMRSPQPIQILPTRLPSVDMRLRSLEVGIYLNRAARVGSEATRRKIQQICVGVPPYSVKQRIRPDLLSALRLRADFALRRFRDLLDLLTQTKSDALAANVITQSLSRQHGDGHYGLPGMQERATLIGGKLTVWSKVDGGTEVELRVPATAAYTAHRRDFWL